MSFRKRPTTPEEFAEWEADRPPYIATRLAFEQSYKMPCSDYVLEYAHRELKRDLTAMKAQEKMWHTAWFDQRDATGRCAWDNYRLGKKTKENT